MKNKRLLAICSILVMVVLLASPALAEKRIKLATTTSAENTGLLEALLPPFEREFGVKVDVIAVGTGKALKLAEDGNVDVVLVHDREAEEEFVAQGFGVNRREVMYNDFVLVGPPTDPAGIGGMSDVAAAFRKISRKQAGFVSRGDDSGTHRREKSIWKAAGVNPGGDWYLEVGQGMGATLLIANEKRGYTLVDQGTFIAYQGKVDLAILSEGDPRLFNPYSIIAVNPAKHPHTNYVYAMALSGWLTSVEGQKIVAEYRKSGQALFHPLAVPKRE